MNRQWTQEEIDAEVARYSDDWECKPMIPLIERLRAWEAWEPPGVGGIPPHVTPPEPVKGEEVIAEIERLRSALTEVHGLLTGRETHPGNTIRACGLIHKALRSPEMEDAGVTISGVASVSTSP
jgi:hypothetical protein